MICRHYNQQECIQLAHTKREFCDAFSLIYHCYFNAGLIESNSLRSRVLEHHALSSTEVVVAQIQHEMFATATIIRDDYLGLPMESNYAAEVALLRSKYQRLAEVSCLADRRCDVSRSLIMDLMAFIAQCCKCRGVDQILVAVHPRHAKFYSRLLGFEQIGGLTEYEAVCRNPAVALALNLSDLEDRSPAAFDRLFGTAFPDTQLAHRPLSAGARHCIDWLLSSVETTRLAEALPATMAQAS